MMNLSAQTARSNVSKLTKVALTTGLTSLSFAVFSPVAHSATIANSVSYDVIGRVFTINSPTFTSVSEGTFSGNSAEVAPGATLSLSGSYSIARGDTSYCPGCIIQGYTAWIAPAPAGSQGFWSGIISGGIFSNFSNPGTFSWTTTAPTTPGEYYIGLGATLDFRFQPNVAGQFGTANGVEAASYRVTVKSVPEPSIVAGLLMIATAAFVTRKTFTTSEKFSREG